MKQLVFLLLGLIILSLGGSTSRAAYSPEIIDPREYGARCDGTTDDTTKLQAAITAAQAKKANIMWPAATCYSATGLTVTKSIGIIGQNFLPRVAGIGAGGDNGSSRLLCPPSAGVTCLKLAPASPTDLTAVHLENMTVSGSGTLGSSAVAGSIGLSTFNGGGYIFNNVQVENFDTCFSAVAQGAGGITFRVNNPFLLACKSHYMVWDGAPDAQIVGGQLGSSNDYPTVSDAILFTRTQTLSAGGGPNTINFFNTNIITGANLACFIKWGGMIPTAGVVTEFRFRDMHLENHTAGGTGTFCSDNTVPALNTVIIDGMVAVTDQRTLFALNPATALVGFWMTNSSVNNCFYTGAPNMFNLAPTPSSGPALRSVYFANNGFCVGPTFVSNGVAANTLFSTGNSYGDMTISGAWSNFESMGDSINALNDSGATGKIAFGGALPQAWVPTLKFGGGSTGLTYSIRNGSLQRTANGGFQADFAIVLINKGSSTGSATITGLPYQCDGFTDGSLTYVTGMTALTGAANVNLPGNIASPPINLYQAAPTGVAALSEAAFTNTATLYGGVQCSKVH